MDKNIHFKWIIITFVFITLLMSGCSSGSAFSTEATEISTDSIEVAFRSNDVLNQKIEELNPEIVTVVSGTIAEKTIDDLEKSSACIIKGEVVDVSDPFQVTSVSGESTAFTDYYLRINESLRGNRENGEVVVIRTRGGLIESELVFDETGPYLELGQQYLVFLLSPDVGGGFNTEGDYYYVNGSTQGIYPFIDGELLVSEFDSAVEEKHSILDYELLKEELIAINENYPVSEINRRQEIIDALTINYNNRLITEEQYHQALQELDMYAVITE